MKILFVGDIVGSVGRQVAIENIQKIKKDKQIDMVIANAENSAHGKGITSKIYNQLINNGVDCITMGNHTFSKDTIYKFIDDADKMIRPVNLQPLNVGNKYYIQEVNGLKVAVVNLMGEVFMYGVEGSPFSTMSKLLKKIEADIIIVDFHGEATSEKLAFANYFKDCVQAVLGTHTHIQTADERLIDGCAYISDAGMCGVYDSILGRDIDETLTRFVTKQKTRYTIAEGDGIFCGVIVEIDVNTKKAIDIQRIQIRPY